MKQSLIYPLIYTIVGGLIVAVLNYWLFVDHKHTDQIRVTHEVFQLDKNDAVSVVDHLTSLDATVKKDALDAIHAALDTTLSGNLTLEKYYVENQDTLVMNNIKFSFDGAFAAFVSDQTVSRSINVKSNFTYPELLPGKAFAIIVLTSDFSTLSQYQTPHGAVVTMEGKALPLSETRVDPSSTEFFVLSTLEGYPFLSFVFFLVAASAWLAAIFGIGITIVANKNIEFRLKNTSDNDLAKMLGLINYLKRRDAKRFEVISELAEKRQRALTGVQSPTSDHLPPPSN